VLWFSAEQLASGLSATSPALVVPAVLMADIVGFTEASDRCEPVLVMQVGESERRGVGSSRHRLRCLVYKNH
jgi:class 3 adenylate cyclase